MQTAMVGARRPGVSAALTIPLLATLRVVVGAGTYGRVRCGGRRFESPAFVVATGRGGGVHPPSTPPLAPFSFHRRAVGATSGFRLPDDGPPTAMDGRLRTTTFTSRRRVLVYKRPNRRRRSPASSGGAPGISNGNGTAATVMPENLRRTVSASRPPLGHVVPRDVRAAQRGGTSNPRLRRQGRARSEGLNNPSNLRIAGGIARGRRLDSPDVYLRPMMGKVREAVFSTLTSFGLFEAGGGGSGVGRVATRQLDVFAGSGSVGIEGLSRGASSATFVDLSRDCCDAVERNLKWCGFDSNTGYDDNGVVCCDALRALEDPASVGIRGKFQLVTMCPPYEEVVYADLLEAVANSDAVEEDTVVVVEYPVELGCLPHVIPRRDGGALVGVRNRRYGRTVIAMYVVNPSGRLEVAESRPEEFVSV